MIKRFRRSPLARPVLIAAELLVKRTLAGILWLAWRARLNPFAFMRGTPNTPGRFYIEQFLRQYAPECQGRFLEFGTPVYRGFFVPGAIERYDVVDVISRPDVTIVADIQSCPAIPDDTYDVIVCTQVLEHVANPFLAAAELHRILKPGGRLLLTVPAVYPYHADPCDYWRFTRDSLRLLFAEGFRDVAITGYGNKLTVVAAHWFWTYDHLPRRALAQTDPDSPSLLAIYARKNQAAS